MNTIMIIRVGISLMYGIYVARQTYKKVKYLGNKEKVVLK